MSSRAGQGPGGGHRWPVMAQRELEALLAAAACLDSGTARAGAAAAAAVDPSQRQAACSAAACGTAPPPAVAAGLQTFQRQDISHLRTFVTFLAAAKAARVMATGGALPADDALALLPDVDTGSPVAMQQLLTRTYIERPEALCAWLVMHVKLGRTPHGPFPTTTREHKVRRLQKFVRLGFAQMHPDRTEECAAINLMDRHHRLWGAVYRAVFGTSPDTAGRASVDGAAAGGAKRKLGTDGVAGRSPSPSTGQDVQPVGLGWRPLLGLWSGAGFRPSAPSLPRVTPPFV